MLKCVDLRATRERDRTFLSVVPIFVVCLLALFIHLEYIINSSEKVRECLSEIVVVAAMKRRNIQLW